ncbi:CvpA family protein [Aestuariibacter halophilus]|uniref:CvpA family protein n=1 Tax=Fluctibacter halophilus TaxID=226011 RepID=A0ABS8G9H8_9ALTE|nr:CvpA family protein [Aestuariibacter halophilus]MCC2616776.1 CvpA family protein [Aestuariibacter halophilus]
MNWIDFTILGVILLSTVISLVRGFIKEALSLAIWFAAFFIASQFYADVATLLTQLQDPMVRNGVAIALLFVATLILGGLLNYLIAQLVQYTGLSGTDRALGSVFGLIRGGLIVAAALFFMDTFTTAASSQWWQTSVLIPEFTPIIEMFFEYLQNNSSFLKPA